MTLRPRRTVILPPAEVLPAMRRWLPRALPALLLGLTLPAAAGAQPPAPATPLPPPAAAAPPAAGPVGPVLVRELLRRVVAGVFRAAGGAGRDQDGPEGVLPTTGSSRVHAGLRHRPHALTAPGSGDMEFSGGPQKRFCKNASANRR